MRLLTAIGFLIVVALVVGIYAWVAESSAEAAAARFCEATPLGEPWPDLEQRIKISSADQRRSKLSELDGNKFVTVIFTGFTPISRHICWITMQAGHVQTKNVSYLD